MRSTASPALAWRGGRCGSAWTRARARGARTASRVRATRPPGRTVSTTGRTASRGRTTGRRRTDRRRSGLRPRPLSFVSTVPDPHASGDGAGDQVRPRLVDGQRVAGRRGRGCPVDRLPRGGAGDLELPGPGRGEPDRVGGL